MSISRYSQLLIVLFLTFHFNLYAQADSISALTTTEYKDDTVYWKDLTIQNFYDNKLIFELKKIGLGREDSEVEMTTNFYDLYGNLVKSIKIEEDRYECAPEWIPEWDPAYPSVTLDTAPLFVYLPLDTGNVTESIIVIPDSIPIESKFCGRYFTKTTHYLPYIIVTNSLSYYDYSDTTYSVDSLFSDRYGDDIRKVTYVNDKKYLEYQYGYVRDEQGRIIKRKWDNLTAGKEFCLHDEYQYNDDQKLQVYHSSEFFSKKTKKRSSKTFYNENFEISKHENYLGDSLTSSSYYSQIDGDYQSIAVNSLGDTTNVTKYIRRESKNKKETWSHESLSSGEYYYGVVDTIRKKDGYCIESHRYSITKEQFANREDSMKKRNWIRYKHKKYFDKLGHLVRELKYDSDELESEFIYDYKTSD